MKKILFIFIILFSSHSVLNSNILFKKLYNTKYDGINYYNNKKYLKYINYFFLQKNIININYELAISFFYIKKYFLASNFFLKYYNDTNLVDALYKHMYCYYLSLLKYDVDKKNIYYLINQLNKYKKLLLNNIYLNNNFLNKKKILLSINFILKKLQYNIFMQDFKKAKYLYYQGNYKNSLFAFSKIIINYPNNIFIEKIFLYFINLNIKIMYHYKNDTFLLQNHNKNILKLCKKFIIKFPKSKYKNYIYNIYNNINIQN